MRWWLPAIGLWTAGLLSVLAGCAAWKGPLALPEQQQVDLRQLVIHCDFPLGRQHRLLDDLDALRETVSGTLSLPTSDEPIHVYLFDSEPNFAAFLRREFPEFPTRRAFFVETDTRLCVYAHWQDRVAEDLRHEVAHGYLHAVVPQLPLWLDEGLAEYFEVPRGEGGLNRPHLEVLLRMHRAGRWSPNLARLERLTSVAAMTQLDYAEAWAWVHWLLESNPARRELLAAHLARIRSRQAELLSAELAEQEPAAAAALVAHLERIAAAAPPR